MKFFLLLGSGLALLKNHQLLGTTRTGAEFTKVNEHRKRMRNDADGGFSVMSGWFIAFIILIGNPQAKAEETDSQGLPHLQIVVTVDWEGEDLHSQNLKAMHDFREHFPEIKIIHFLNAAYFTKPNTDSMTARQKISKVLRPGDELGLHIHAWKSLVEAANVEYHATPSWDSDAPEDDCAVDCGHSVPLTSYKTEELEKIIGYSVKTLKKQGFNISPSFRAGGWIADQNVLTALVNQGFHKDFSAVPHHYLQVSNAAYIEKWIQQTWPGMQDTTQPYEINIAGKKITEVPDNGCLADYVTAEDIYNGFLKNYRSFQQDPKQDHFYVIGFHQETANEYIDRVTKAIDKIQRYSQKNHLPVTFTTALTNAF